MPSVSLVMTVAVAYISPRLPTTSWRPKEKGPALYPSVTPPLRTANARPAGTRPYPPTYMAAGDRRMAPATPIQPAVEVTRVAATHGPTGAEALLLPRNNVQTAVPTDTIATIITVISLTLVSLRLFAISLKNTGTVNAAVTVTLIPSSPAPKGISLIVPLIVAVRPTIFGVACRNEKGLAGVVRPEPFVTKGYLATPPVVA